MNVVAITVQLALAAAALVALTRAIRGPSLADRIIAVDLVLLLLAGGIAVQSVREGSEFFMPALIVVALVAFAGTIIVSRFIEWRDTP